MVLNLRLQIFLRSPLLHCTALCGLGLVAGSALLSTKAIAQVAADTTLATPSTVSFDGTTHRITAGTTNGNNLFHSFEAFSLSSGETAQFDNNTTIENIISRVTGTSTSRINGLIEANGDANLFLLNPNGIVFGANAELNIGGSFFATTADSFLFDEGEFSSTDPQEAPLLAINTPIGLQFGANPGTIRVNGPGSSLFVDPTFFDVVRSDRPPGLEVASGQTLALVGGNVVLNGGNVTASQGRLELGSVGENETVLIDSSGSDSEWILDYDQVDTFGTLRFAGSASADLSGEGGGDAQIYGRTLTLKDGSAILSNTLGADNGGTLNIQLSNALIATDTSIDPANGFALMPSGIFGEVSIGSTGNGSSITLDVPKISLTGGAQVAVVTFSAGNAGVLNVTAQDISLAGLSSDEFFASILGSTADVEATGRGGIVNVETDTLSVTDSAELSVVTFGPGDGGDINISAEEIRLDNSARIIAAVNSLTGEPGDLSTTGNGGSITIDSNQIRLTNLSQITAATSSAGNSGAIAINAETIDLREGAVIGTDVLEGSTGNGGPLSIQANAISATDGAQILVATAGSGAAGDLTINAQTIDLKGFDDFASSGLVANAVIGEGNGGDIDVIVDELTIEDGATVTVGNFGTQATTPSGSGESGRIFVNANVIKLENEGSITASSLNGRGDINITSEFLLLSDRSDITTNALGIARGGDIIIDTGVLSGIGNSDITANAVNDFGGRIIITADNIFGFQVSELINPAQSGTNDITASSRLGSQFGGTVQLNTPDSDSAQLVARLEDDVIDQSTLVGTVCALDQETNTLVVAGAGGLPTSPVQYLESNSVWHDLRLEVPSNNAEHNTEELVGANGRSPLSSPELSYRSLQEVNAWQKTQGGNIELIAYETQTTSNRINECHRSQK